MDQHGPVPFVKYIQFFWKKEEKSLLWEYQGKPCFVNKLQDVQEQKGNYPLLKDISNYNAE